jgi:hypothetical protein
MCTLRFVKEKLTGGYPATKKECVVVCSLQDVRGEGIARGGVRPER